MRCLEQRDPLGEHRLPQFIDLPWAQPGHRVPLFSNRPIRGAPRGRVYSLLRRERRGLIDVNESHCSRVADGAVTP